MGKITKRQYLVILIMIVLGNAIFWFFKSTKNNEKNNDGELIAVENASDLAGTWITGASDALFIFRDDGFFDIRYIGIDNLNELDKNYSIKYFISNDILYTQSRNEKPARRGSPAYMNSDKNILYLYDDTNKAYYRINIYSVLDGWDEAFIRVTNASQILGSWTDPEDGSISYTFYNDGTCDVYSSRRRYTIDYGNIHIYQGEENYGNRTLFLSGDGKTLYFDLQTNFYYIKK